MSKKIKIFIVVAIILILVMQISSAIAARNPLNDNSFFYTNKSEINQGEVLEITIDISKIKYDAFIIKLSSNIDTNSFMTNEDISLKKDNNEISMDIDKSKTNINKITLYYNVPESVKVGTKIELTAQIIVGGEKENSFNNTDTTEIEYKVVETKEVDVKIIEKEQTDNQEKPKEQMNMDNIPNKQDINNSFENNNAFQSNNSNISMPSSKQTMSYSLTNMNYSSMPSQAETAVYNGSNNNYLESLEIEGENLNTTFNKENNTYFIQTNGKTELSVIATSEDDSAKVYVSGSDSLKTGDNKVLISVTAENGDVRYYRVFVNNK